MIPTLALLSALIVDEARAQDVFDGDLIEIVSPGVLQGDGGTVVVGVLALQPDGTPLTGLSLKTSATEGKAEGWSSVGGGWYNFRYTAPATERPIDVTLTATGKNGSDSIDVSLKVPVLPAGSGKVAVKASPARMVLGDIETSRIKFTLEGLQESDLRATVSSGELSAIKDVGGGVYSATYKAPGVNYPHLALITVTSADQGGVVGQGVIELQGAVDFPMTGAAGSQVSLVIAGETYGPTTMNASGSGAVPIIVSPGVNDATKLIVIDGESTREAFDLQIPATRRMSWVPTPAVPADGQAHLLYLAIREATGAPELAASPTVTASEGSVGAVRHLRDGIYVVTYTPPEKSSAATVTLEASLGAAEQAKTSHSLDLLPAFPSATAGGSTPKVSKGPVAQVVVMAAEHQVAPDGEVSVRIAAVDRFGYPVAGVPVKVSVDGGSAPGATTTGPDGTGSITVKAGSAGMMRISAVAGERRTETSILVADGVADLTWPRSAGLQGLWEGLDTTSGMAGASAKPKPDPVAVVPDPVPDPKPDKPVKPPSNHEIPWLRSRVGLGFGSYRYAQRPSVDSGPLLPASLVVGGKDGGRPAPLVGLDTDVRAWFLDWFGAHLSFGAHRYSITAESFDEAPSDWLVRFQADVNGRIPIKLGDNLVWIGANAGFEIDDFILFRGCLDPGCRVEYEPLTTPSLDLGGEIGLEMGPVFVIGALTQGLSSGSVPYRLSGELDLGLELSDAMFVNLGGGIIGRKLPLVSIETGTEIGEIQDRQLLGRVSIGFQL